MFHHCMVPRLLSIVSLVCRFLPTSGSIKALLQAVSQVEREQDVSGTRVHCMSFYMLHDWS